MKVHPSDSLSTLYLLGASERLTPVTLGGRGGSVWMWAESVSVYPVELVWVKVGEV